MRSLAIFFLGVALTGLTGCGASPSAAPMRRVVSAVSPIAKAPAKPATPAATAPSISSSTGATTGSTASTALTAGMPATASGTASAPANGSLKLDVAVAGTAPVASLDLKVVAAGDTADAADFPLTIDQGHASWSQGDVPPGNYTFSVEALASDGSSLGKGNTQAVVQPAKETDVALNLQVNQPQSAASDTATPTPAPDGAGLISLTINIQ